MTDEANLDAHVVAFLKKVAGAMGLDVAVTPEVTDDHVRLNMTGEGAAALTARQGETLDALQVIVNTVFGRDARRDRHYVIDAAGFRKDKDDELRQTAKALAREAQTTGTPQEIGPLNPYARRIVHLSVAEEAGVASESIGDAFLKVVVISRKA